MNDPLSLTIAFVLMNFTATFTAAGLLIAVIVIVVKRPSRHIALATLLNWFLLFGIGITYIFNGIMHTVFGDLSASLIGWENNGFQAEVGFASIGIGIVALMAFPQRMPYSLKLAALVGPACFLWGAAGAHIADIIARGNMSSHNAGVVLYTDIIVPIIGFGLWAASFATRERGQTADRDAHDGSNPAAQPAAASAHA